MICSIRVTLLFTLGILLNPVLAQTKSKSQTNDSQNIVKVDFNTWFMPKTLRVDYLLAGNNEVETAYFSQMKEEPNYGGPQNQLIDPFSYGTYRYLLKDSVSGKIIFTKGFSTLFQEWRATEEAKKIQRAFPMTAVMPFPKNTVKFIIERRSNKTNEFEKFFERYIDPTDYFILKESVPALKFTMIRNSGKPAGNVDIALISEGYTAMEMDKFRADAKRISDYIMSVSPYTEFAGKFNFYAIEAPSAESGVTIPGKDIYVSTNIHSSFYTFNMDRYLTSFDTKSMYDIAAVVPYDLIFVLVNSKRYGGGGFYNHYGEGTVDHQLSEIVAVHEFGHQFAGLADEYYTSEITYSDFYNLKFEPWEPNITTNVDFKSKWAYMVTPGTPIPTPRTDKFKESVGMFEGGGYVAKGVYSPVMDCRMKSNEAPGFCPACKEAIRKMIKFYTE